MKALRRRKCDHDWSSRLVGRTDLRLASRGRTFQVPGVTTGSDRVATLRGSGSERTGRRVGQTALLLLSVVIASSVGLGASRLVSSPSKTLNTQGLTRSKLPLGFLVSCSGSASGSHVSFSFDGLNVDWHWTTLGKFVLHKHGRVVMRADSVVGFPVIITAPHTQGLICIAKMVGYTSPVVLYFVVSGASVGAELQALYPKATGRYSSASFQAINRISPEIRVLGGSPALVLGDPRFDCLFVACVGTFSPVLIEHLIGGRLVNVSDQFPSIIRAEAASLSAVTHQKWFKTDGVWTFIGELEAWVADECRIGRGNTAWLQAENEVEHGQFKTWMAQFEPHFIEQLGADLKRWGYCSSAP